MGCSTCSNGSPSGCGDKGHCQTGGCNKKNTFDWLSIMDIPSVGPTKLYEVSFKNGAQKGFFENDNSYDYDHGDIVVVEARNGYDIGRISLGGDLVRLQMKKKRYKDDVSLQKILRKAHDRDLERLTEARGLEKDTLIRARAIIKTLGLDMKLADVQYQGDKRKATFLYTAEGRIDFRELVRVLAGEFRVKIEMRQIGSRQESARIGGIGSCGRELCCSTWLSDFKSVSTSAARYQNLAINQAKLSGQCGRLKCCLNYELDTYMEALEEFPKKADVIKLKEGKASLVKMDIFKKLMFYSVPSPKGRSNLIAVHIDTVKEALELNKKGEFPEALAQIVDPVDETETIEFADVTGQIDLPYEKTKKRRRPQRRNKKQGQNPNKGTNPKARNQAKKRPNTKKTTNQDPKSKDRNKK